MSFQIGTGGSFITAAVTVCYVYLLLFDMKWSFIRENKGHVVMRNPVGGVAESVSLDMCVALYELWRVANPLL